MNSDLTPHRSSNLSYHIKGLMELISCLLSMEDLIIKVAFSSFNFSRRCLFCLWLVECRSTDKMDSVDNRSTDLLNWSTYSIGKSYMNFSMIFIRSLVDYQSTDHLNL